MRLRPNGVSTLNVESLEARDVPAALIADSFEASAPFYAPAGWQQWSSNGSQYYAVQRTGVTGAQSLAVYGSNNVESRIWQATAVSHDVSLSLAVRSNTPAPIVLLARGQSLNTPNASFLGVAVANGGVVSFRETSKGTTRTLKSVAPTTPVAAQWLRVTADFVGTQAAVRIQRLDTMQFLTASGQWQSADAKAIDQALNLPIGSNTGLVGLGRLRGNYGTASVDDFTATPIVKATSGPKFEHIRIAQLAYNGQKITDVEKTLFANTVDLAIINPLYLDTFETVSAPTPKTVYSNVSNVYEGHLVDWLETADRIGVSRETAFYHVSQPSVFSGSSQSSTPVTWFWNAAKTNAAGTATNITRNARGTSTAVVAFGNTGEAVALGSVDRFAEMNLTLSKTAAAGFTGIWEYASAVDATGKAIAWKLLTLTTDTTVGLRQSGRVAFTPPADWLTSKVNTDDRLYHVRFRTTLGSTVNAPVANRIHGRDYVNANGTKNGVIPAYDQAADINNDGYLNDAEFPNRKAGSDARFPHESRLFYPYYGQMRFVVNPTAPAVKQWAGAFHAELLAASPNADGLFLDNANGKLPFAGTPVVESTTTYTAESAAVVAAVKKAIGGRTIISNTSGGGAGAFADGITRESGIAFEEFLLRPDSANWSTVNDIAAVVNRRLAASPTAQVVLDSLPGKAGRNDPRTRMGVLSYYYLLADPARTYLAFFGGDSPTSPWSERWVPAAAVNVGQPKGAMTVFASGFDPTNPLLQYKVLSRSYDNALTLYKPLSYTLGKGTGTNVDATATTHALNGNYRVLNQNGTQGAVITSITLRNGEGVVLMKA